MAHKELAGDTFTSSNIGQLPYEHPFVWECVGKNRYVQAAFSKPTARLYASRFDTTTSKKLAVEAARGGLLGLLQWCQQVGCNWSEKNLRELFIAGAEGGSLSVMDWLDACSHRDRDDNEVSFAAGKGGHTRVFEWLDARYFKWGSFCNGAAGAGHTAALRWAYGKYPAWIMHTTGKKDNNWTLESACIGGHVETIEWLLENRCPLDIDRCVNGIIRCEKMESLAYLHARRLPRRDARMSHIAARLNRFEILKWLEKEGYPIGPEVVDYAARNGNLAMAKWAEEVNGGCLTADTCLNAVYAGSLEIVQWLRAEGCPWHGETLRIARKHGFREIAEWALAKGCPEPVPH